ncbi:MULTISPECIES: hypothetical protein [unclassified Sphingomonas]|jgi:hypothetical protein|uniref:hypothetical protein n=1 Tax=unclassified Sphingomonas TaxID=196159 RepID=UPI00053D8998|nr:hypothetical protein [Sphingomonas sp. Ant H11]
MADYYGLEFVGAADGSQNPPKKLDVRMVGGKKRRVRSTKPAVALAIGDRLYLGKLPQGASLHSISGITDTSFATTTISIGTTTIPAKYVAAKTLTATDAPTPLGPKASAFVLDPNTVDEDLWATFGVADIGAGVIAGFDIEYTTAN